MFTKRLLIIFQLFFCVLKTKCGNGETKNPSIIIVGAGASGQAAATKLLKNNISNIKILEAENRIGGRIHSIKFGDAFIDLGAEFCHGESNNIVYDMVKDLNILKRSSSGVREFLFQSGGAEISSRLSEKILGIVQDILQDNDTCTGFQSVGDCLDTQYEKLLNDTKDDNEKSILKKTKLWIHNSVASADSPLDLHDISSNSQFEESDGVNHLNWNGLGYKTILDILMQKYPATATPLPIDDKILLNKEVIKVSNWDKNEKVEISCKDGNSFTADLVLFSPSIGVLKANHQTLFEPQLPQYKIDAIHNIGFGVIMKIFMEFAENTTLDYAIATIFREDEFGKKRGS